MPTYQYKCKACNHEFEEFQSMSSDPLVKCPKCGKRKLVRVISGAGLVFKGSGFYLTDYKKQGSSPAESSHESKSSDDGGKETKSSDGGKKDSKSSVDGPKQSNSADDGGREAGSSKEGKKGKDGKGGSGGRGSTDGGSSEKPSRGGKA